MAFGQEISELLSRSTSLAWMLSLPQPFAQNKLPFPFSAGKDTNILTEQIDKDVTRIHKLEYENQKLQSELQEIKVN